MNKFTIIFWNYLPRRVSIHLLLSLGKLCRHRISTKHRLFVEPTQRNVHLTKNVPGELKLLAMCNNHCCYYQCLCNNINFRYKLKETFLRSYHCRTNMIVEYPVVSHLLYFSYLYPLMPFPIERLLIPENNKKKIVRKKKHKRKELRFVKKNMYLICCFLM